MLETPLIVVNVKAYPQGTGRGLDGLLDAIAPVADDRVAVAVQGADIPRAVDHDVTVLAQHVDPAPPGSHTGCSSIESICDAGAAGSLINHSERPATLTHIAEAVRRLGEEGLASIVCADTVPATRAAATLGPDLVAVEPPELIGGDVSVTTADPGIVEDSVQAVQDVAPDVDVLCGAGVKTGDDVAKARELGAEGVLLASGVAKADEPAKVLDDLLGGLGG